jgi:hypothetical protein
MPGIIDTETVHADKLPAIWSPVQWELDPDEKAREIEEQATASLLWVADAPEAILRLLLRETAIERAFDPPEGYDPAEQGEWEEDLITFAFQQPIELQEVRREAGRTVIVYKFNDLGYWEFDITPEKVIIRRV